jgi:hypothetical protein
MLNERENILSALREKPLKVRRFSRSTQVIARSASLSSAFPYNVTRTERPPGLVFVRIIWMPPMVSQPGHCLTAARHSLRSAP